MTVSLLYNEDFPGVKTSPEDDDGESHRNVECYRRVYRKASIVIDFKDSYYTSITIS